MSTTQKKKEGIKGALHVLAYKDKEKGRYIAHCLDFNIAAEGATHKEAKDNLVDLIFSYIHFAVEKNLEQYMYDPAPKAYWNKFIEVSHRKRIPRPQFIDPSLFKTSKSQIKDLIQEKRASKIPTHV